VKKKPAQVDDADVDAFIERFWQKLNPALSAEQRADGIEDTTLALLGVIQPEMSPQYVKEFARKVRARVLWLKPSQ